MFSPIYFSNCWFPSRDSTSSIRIPKNAAVNRQTRGAFLSKGPSKFWKKSKKIDSKTTFSRKLKINLQKELTSYQLTVQKFGSGAEISIFLFFFYQNFVFHFFSFCFNFVGSPKWPHHCFPFSFFALFWARGESLVPLSAVLRDREDNKSVGHCFQKLRWPEICMKMEVFVRFFAEKGEKGLETRDFAIQGQSTTGRQK